MLKLSQSPVAPLGPSPPRFRRADTPVLVQGDGINEWREPTFTENALYCDAVRAWEAIPEADKPARCYTQLAANDEWEVVELAGRFHLVKRDRPARTGLKRAFWAGPEQAPQHRGASVVFVLPRATRNNKH